MIRFKRIDHIHICVPPGQLDEARAFYTGVIGLELIERPDHLFNSPGYWLTAGNIELHIGVEPYIGRTIRHSAFEVEDIAEARRVLEENDIEFIAEPVIPGRERFAFLDPFGNRMELLQYI